MFWLRVFNKGKTNYSYTQSQLQYATLNDNHLNIITYLLAKCRGVLPLLSFELGFAPARTRYSQTEMLLYLREERVDHGMYEYYIVIPCPRCVDSAGIRIL